MSSPPTRRRPRNIDPSVAWGGAPEAKVEVCRRARRHTITVHSNGYVASWSGSRTVVLLSVRLCVGSAVRAISERRARSGVNAFISFTKGATRKAHYCNLVQLNCNN